MEGDVFYHSMDVDQAVARRRFEHLGYIHVVRNRATAARCRVGREHRAARS